MCWLGKIDKKNFLTEDIFCYKVLTPGFTSYYKNFQYSLNGLYTIDNLFVIPTQHNTLVSIEYGFHSYSVDCAFLITYNNFCQSVMIKSKSRDDGKSRIMLDHIVSGCLVHCQIPKGAECYENQNGEIVSNKIMIKNVVATI